jgi:murein DD-endopeptidase MepM/ murein hydrolase activator NlpD
LLLRRLARALLVAAGITALLIPTVGSLADQSNELQKTQKELEEVRSKLQSDRVKATSTKHQIEILERDLTTLQIAIGKLDVEIAKVQSQVRDAEARVKELKGRMAEVQNRATEQAAALYKSGQYEVLNALLESTSLAELDARAEMLGVAAEENTSALIQFGRLKVQVERESRRLFEKQELLRETRGAKAQLYADQKTRKEELAASYAQLSDRVSKLKRREGDLSADVDRIRDEILANQAKRAVENLGKSAQGFIWPLNGPITSGYGPRWGRMHTGIDIDGYSGQPIVASKGGNVILASSYSGYGNSVIVDHGGGVATLYAHMSSFGVSAGQSVSQGQVVGNVGCTGSCTGDHLHFEVRVNGSPVNPLNYLP